MLPNGWKIRLGAQVVYATDGSLLSDSKGNYLEGIGIAPDIYVQDKLKEIRQGKDAPLDAALKEIVKKIR
jgi:C-terminal processing protease CtpA/Prc